MTETRRAVEALRASEERFRTVIENSRDGINMLDLATGRYVFMSPAQAELTGFSLEEMANFSAEEAHQRVHPDDREISIGQQKEVAAGRDLPGPVEYRWKVKSGEYRWFSDSRRLVRDAHGRPVALVGVSRDITEQKRAEAALRRSETAYRSLAEVLQGAEQALRAVDRRKNDFLAVLSHELRNPLAPIRNSLHLLGRVEPGGPEARRALAIIRRQVDQLARLVDDLLDITRITKGKVELQRGRIELNDLARRTLEDHRSIFERAGVSAGLSATPEPLFVHGDWNRLAQVLGNLLQNSAKFTPAEGRVTVSLEREGAQALLRVSDTGVGLAPSLLPRLFEPFMQAGEALDRGHGGLGLGLSLVKGLVELHGGDVSAFSAGPGLGTTFTVHLPLIGGRASPPARVVSPGPVTPRRVLIIEDNVDAAETLRDVLALDGHQVEVAHDGRAGIAEALRLRPEVVLCDLGLPGLDGFVVARVLRAEQSLAESFFVALSGYAQPLDLERARQVGFDQHLAKPPDLDALRAMLAGPALSGR